MADGKKKYITDNKTCKVSFKLSEEELRYLDGFAKLLRMNRSQYLRELVKYAGRVDSTYAEDRSKFIRQITGIATNVNQIAKLANTNGYVVEEDITETHRCLKEAISLMREVLDVWQSQR